MTALTPGASMHSTAEMFFNESPDRDLEWDGPRRVSINPKATLPWLLLLSCLAGGVILRMLRVIQVIDHQGTTVRLLWAVVVAGTALAALVMARSRDAVTGRHVTDAAVLAFSTGAFTWLFPHSIGVQPDRTLERLGLAAVAGAAGLLVGALIILALARARMSMATVSFIMAGTLILVSALFFAEQRALGLVLAVGAWGFGVAGWNDQNPATVRPPDSAVLRSPRSFVSLASAAVSLYGLQQAFQRNLWSDNIPVMIALGFTFAAALASVFDSRRTIEDAATRDWASWRAEVEVDENRRTRSAVRLERGAHGPPPGPATRIAPAWASPARQALSELDSIAPPAGLAAAPSQQIDDDLDPFGAMAPAASPMVDVEREVNPVVSNGSPAKSPAPEAPAAVPAVPAVPAVSSPIPEPPFDSSSAVDAQGQARQRGLIEVPSFGPDGTAHLDTPLPPPEGIPFSPTSLDALEKSNSQPDAPQSPNQQPALEALTAWSADGRLQAATPSFWQLIERPEQSDFSLLNVIAPADAPRVASQITHATRTGEPFELTARQAAPHSPALRMVGCPIDPVVARLGHLGAVSYQIGVEAVALPPESPSIARNAQSTAPPPPAAFAGADPVTGIPGLERLDEWLNSRPVLQRRLGDRSMLLVCELMPMSEWDGADPAARDLIAAEMSMRLRQALRSSDFLIRVEGPWFVAVIEEAAGSSKPDLVRRFVEVLTATVLISSRPYRVNGRVVGVDVVPGQTLDHTLDQLAAAVA